MTAAPSAPVFAPSRSGLVVRAVVSAIGFLVLGSITVGIATDVEGSANNLTVALSVLGMVGTWFGLLVQYYKPQLGLAISALFLSVLGASALFTFPLAYSVVCYESYFISSRVRVRRRAWLTTLVVGSFIALAWFVICNAFLVDTSGQGLALQRQQARDLFVQPEFWAASVMTSLLVVVSIALMWLWGRVAFRRNQEVEMLAARAELATVSERNRIAREMHDIVAHSLTGIIAQADGGRYAGQKNPDVALQALDTIASSGRDALKQMRGLLSVLHEDSPRERGAVPGVGALPDLLSDAQRNGLSVTLHAEGDEHKLDEARGLTIYRVVQESLTNVLKHAGPVETQVWVRWASDNVKIQVDNAKGEAKVEGSGRGLAGIRERVSIYGGRATWGSSDIYPGGWNVTAMIPVEAM